MSDLFSDSRFLPESFERKEPCMTIEYQDGKLNRRKPRASGSLLKGKNCFLPESFERKEPCMTTEHQDGKLPFDYAQGSKKTPRQR